MGGEAAPLTVNEYVEHDDEVTYKLKFRVSKATFSTLSGLLRSQGYLRHNTTSNT